MIVKIFGVKDDGERVQLDFAQLLLVTHEREEIEINIEQGPQQEDFTLHARADCTKGLFRQIILYPGASNLVRVKLWSPKNNDKAS